jgi:O-antigen/teichoic acid export membrane protein
MKTGTEIIFQVRRNFLRTGGVTIFTCFLNAALNLALLGWFAREGGVALVGTWSLLNAILMYVLVLDFGLTNALTRVIAIKGAVEAAPLIRWLLTRLAGLICLGVSAHFLICLTRGANSEIAIAWGLAGLAACFQLASNWLICFRLGRYQQYYFNLKSIVRVAVQTSLIFTFYAPIDLPTPVLFGAALAFAGFCELLFAGFIVRGPDLKSVTAATSANFSDIRQLSRGFGMADAVNRVRQPLLQILIASIAGNAALGVFTIALRVPTVLSQSVSEAMRVLFPGLSNLQKSGDRPIVTIMLRNGFLVQLLIVVPACIFLLIAAEDILGLWLGQTTQTQISATRLITIGIMINSLSVPFFWALNAFGYANRIAWAGLAGLLLSGVFGTSVLLLLPNPIPTFCAIYAFSQILTAALIAWWAESRAGLLFASLSQIRWANILLFWTAFIVFSLGLFAGLTDHSPELRLGSVSLIVAAASAVVLGSLYRNGGFQHPNPMEP